MDLHDNDIFENVKQKLNQYFHMDDQSFNINRTTNFYKCFEQDLDGVINDHSNKNNFHIISLNKNSNFCMDLYNVFPLNQEFSVTKMNECFESFEKNRNGNNTVKNYSGIRPKNEYLSFYDNVSNRIYDNVSNRIIVMRNNKDEPIVLIEQFIPSRL